MISASELKKGSRLVIDGDPYSVLAAQTQTPSARGAASLVKVKVRNLRTDQVLDKSYKTDERFEEPDLERKPFQFLYEDGEQLVFMDQTTFDQLYVTRDELGDAALYLVDNLELKLIFYNGKLLDVELPTTIELVVDTVEPVTRGDTARGTVLKPASLTNGMRVMVPQYVKEGDRIRVSTKDGSFAERVQ